MTDRLDPHTAQCILDAMKAARDRKRYGSTEERATECREDMLEAVEDTCKAAIAEAASRPPTLSDCRVDSSFRGRLDLTAANDACWPYAGRRNAHGYGRMMVLGRQVQAHRWAWELMNGPIPKGMLVCHHCDNPPCCNPSHLFLGTPQDNTNDMVKKGRARHPVGSDAAGAKLTEDQVRSVWELWQMGESQTAISAALSMSRVDVERIVSGRSWSHMIPDGAKLANRVRRGQERHGSKLTSFDVEAIRLNEARLSNRELAIRFGVAKSTIGDIRTGKKWSAV